MGRLPFFVLALKSLEMELPKKVQSEILKELEKMYDSSMASLKNKEIGSGQWAYDRGRVTAFRAAIMVIEEWNEPNHGKVVAEVWRCNSPGLSRQPRTSGSGKAGELGKNNLALAGSRDEASEETQGKGKEVQGGTPS